MILSEETIRYDNHDVFVGGSTCNACGGEFAVLAQSREEPISPKFCPFCGTKFTHHQEADGSIQVIDEV